VQSNHYSIIPLLLYASFNTPAVRSSQSFYRAETTGHYRSLLVSIQAFNGGLSRSILPIRTHRYI